MANTQTFTKTIKQLDRVRNSRDGNPRYRVEFTDGTVTYTSPNSSMAYEAESIEYRDVPVDVTFNRKTGFIDFWELSKKTES